MSESEVIIIESPVKAHKGLSWHQAFSGTHSIKVVHSRDHHSRVKVNEAAVWAERTTLGGPLRGDSMNGAELPFPVAVRCTQKTGERAVFVLSSMDKPLEEAFKEAYPAAYSRKSDSGSESDFAVSHGLPMDAGIGFALQCLEDKLESDASRLHESRKYE